jgi:hypothetical protein
MMHRKFETAIAAQHGIRLQFQLFSFFECLLFCFISNKYCCAALWIIFLPCLGNIIGMWRALTEYKVRGASYFAVTALYFRAESFI